ncbi:hypothetical protein NQ318_006154 [Aromia moschata]|uniref:Uncharacterized protein n=1 Tax=Aromia moschata TaxID=1265417 RepID=A0AAV8XM53_9CUCU|nr:hypothetical protein NQ318_006154 [Aromia moschata]
MGTIVILQKIETKELALEFFKLAFEEDKDGHAFFVLAVVHGSASYLPDILPTWQKTTQH